MDKVWEVLQHVSLIHIIYEIGLSYSYRVYSSGCVRQPPPHYCHLVQAPNGKIPYSHLSIKATDFLPMGDCFSYVIHWCIINYVDTCRGIFLGVWLALWHLKKLLQWSPSITYTAETKNFVVYSEVSFAQWVIVDPSYNRGYLCWSKTWKVVLCLLIFSP